MRARHSLTLALGASLALIAACGGSDAAAPSGTAVNGTWFGGISNGDATIQLTITLSEASEVITGSGTFGGSHGFSCPATVTGTRDAEKVNLSFKCTGYVPVAFTGHELDAKTIAGHVSGSGYPTSEFDLFKQ